MKTYDKTVANQLLQISRISDVMCLNICKALSHVMKEIMKQQSFYWSGMQQITGCLLCNILKFVFVLLALQEGAVDALVPYCNTNMGPVCLPALECLSVICNHPHVYTAIVNNKQSHTLAKLLILSTSDDEKVALEHLILPLVTLYISLWFQVQYIYNLWFQLQYLNLWFQLK